MTNQFSETNLHDIQEFFDYWLEEGGNVIELEKKIWAEIEVVRKDFIERGDDIQFVVEFCIPHMQALYGALWQLENTRVDFSKGGIIVQEEEEEMGKMKEQELTAEKLMFDYGLYNGQIIANDEENVLEPTEYLEEFMEMAYEPPKKVCREFLKFFYGDEAIDDWMKNISWEEDESEGKIEEVPEAVLLLKDQGIYLEALEAIHEVQKEFLKVDWDWYGLQDLCEDGTIDEKMYYRMWLSVRDLGVELDYDHHVEILQVLQEEITRFLADGTMK